MDIKLLNDIKTFIQTFSSSKIITTILPVIITNFLTYHFTYKNIKNKSKRKINKKSFDLVYLPLHRIFSKTTIYDISKNDTLILYYKCLNLSEKNYIYTSPILIKLLRDLKKKIDKDAYLEDILYKIYSHINKEYKKLRSYLNYPCANLIDSWNYFYTALYKYIFFNFFFLYFLLILLFLLGFLIETKFSSTIITLFTNVMIILIFLYLIIFMIGGTYLICDFILKRIKLWKRKKKVNKEK